MILYKEVTFTQQKLLLGQFLYQMGLQPQKPKKDTLY